MQRLYYLFKKTQYKPIPPEELKNEKDKTNIRKLIKHILTPANHGAVMWGEYAGDLLEAIVETPDDEIYEAYLHYLWYQKRKKYIHEILEEN